MNVFNKIIERLYFLQKNNLALYCQYTKAYNRNWWIKVARKKFNRKDCFITIVDVDNLKQYNDSYGHLAGNLLIKSLSSTLLKVFREGCYVCRYGGDEFILITSYDPTKKLKVLSSNFSFGVYHKSSMESLKVAFREADRVLYEMKKDKKGTL